MLKLTQKLHQTYIDKSIVHLTKNITNLQSKILNSLNNSRLTILHVFIEVCLYTYLI